MTRLRQLLHRMYNALRPARAEPELAREVGAHLELLEQQFRRRGLDAVDARNAARRAFGSVEWVKDAHRDARSFIWLDEARRDCQYALRSLRRSPSVSLVVLLSFGLGIGLNAVVFSVLNGLLFRPQVDRDPGSFARVYLELSGDWHRDVYGNRFMATLEDFDTIRSNTRTLSAVTASRPATFTLDGGGAATLRGRLVSCNYLAVHHWPVLMGRGFEEADCAAPDVQPVAVLSRRGWATGFASDPNIVGRTIRLNNQPMTIIGVTPDTQVGEPLLPHVYVPYTMQPALLGGNYFRDSPSQLAWLDLAGRLKDGLAAADAQSELAVIMKSLDRIYPGRATDVVVTNGALIRAPGLARAGALLIGLALGSASLVLLLVCTNVTGLLFARVMRRQHEIAVRLSVGAGRSRLVRQLLTETFVLAFLAASGSVALAAFVAAPVAQMLTPFPVGAWFGPDWRVVAYTLAMALAATAIGGLAPALASPRFELTRALKQSGSTNGTWATPHQRATLIAGQVSLTLVLLVATGLVVRAQHRVLSPQLDYDPGAVTVTAIDLTTRGYSAGMVRGFYDQLLPRLETLPGVSAVALTSAPPFHAPARVAVTADDGETRAAWGRAVSSNYFQVMHVPITRGHTFPMPPTPGSNRQVPVVISESLARLTSASPDVLGRRLRFGNGTIGDIVGIAADTSSVRVGVPDGPMLYLPAGDADFRTGAVLMLGSGDLRALTRTIARLVQDIDPDVRTAPETVATTITRQASQYDAAVSTTGLSAVLAVVLSFTGLYGMMTFAAAQRTREIGVRLALGAQRRAIVVLFMRALWRPLATGLATGLPLAALVAIVMQRTRVFADVRPGEPWAYAAAVLLVAATTMLATLVPAVSVSRTAPIEALRND